MIYTSGTSVTFFLFAIFKNTWQQRVSLLIRIDKISINILQLRSTYKYSKCKFSDIQISLNLNWKEDQSVFTRVYSAFIKSCQKLCKGYLSNSINAYKAF